MWFGVLLERLGVGWCGVGVWYGVVGLEGGKGEVFVWEIGSVCVMYNRYLLCVKYFMD